MSSELIARLPHSAAGSATPDRSHPASERGFDPLAILHDVSLRIARSQDLTAELPAIARTILDLLDLDSISLSLRKTNLLVHAGRGSDHEPAKGDTGVDDQSATLRTVRADEHRRVESEPSAASDRSVRIPLHYRDESAGFMLVGSRNAGQLDAGLIDLLGKIGDIIVEHFEAELRSQQPADETTSQESVRTVLGLISRVSLLAGIDASIQSLLAEIAEALNACSVSVVVPDPVEPRLFASDEGRQDQSDDEICRLLSVPAVRLALNSGESQPGIRSSETGGLGNRSAVLAVPLIARDESIGIMIVERPDGRWFSSQESELATIVGRGLSHSLEREHRVRAHSRQNLLLSLVERVTAFIARSTDADDLLALMTREIRRTFGYDCSIAMISGDRLVIDAIELGEHAHVPEWVRDGIPMGAGIIGRVARTGKPVFVRDVSADPAFIDTGRNTVSEIAVPIRIADQVVGVLNVESDENNPLHTLDFEILNILANHIGIALSNRKLIAAERSTRLAMEALQRVSTIVAETLDPDESLRRIAVTLGEGLGYPIVSLALLEERKLTLRATYGYEPGNLRTIHIDEGISGRVARTGLPVLVEDVSRDPDYIREWPGITSEVCVPIRCNDEIIGVLNVEGTRERPVTQRDLQLLTTFAEHAGVLLNNARAYAALSREATIDPMTGVPNLRFFQQELQSRLERARREEQPLSLAVIDLDDLKEINDSHGHLAGDQVLRELAERMQQQLRCDDLLARYAGDEFVALLPGVGEHQALGICERLLRAARRNPFEINNGAEIHLSLSIGVATYPHDAGDSTDLLRASDMAMYVAKESGKNRASNARLAREIRERSQG